MPMYQTIYVVNPEGETSSELIDAVELESKRRLMREIIKSREPQRKLEDKTRKI